MKIPAAKTYYKTSDILKALPKIIFGKFKRGKTVDKFEKEFARFCNSEYSYALPSARVCLYYLLKTLELPANSEVLLTPITIADIVNMILCNNLAPRFADMDVTTLNFSIDSLKNNLTPKTKIIIITYLYGFIPPNIEEIIEIAQKNNLIIIEDFSQALGAEYKNKTAGTLGDFGIYSLSSFKTCSTLFGGMIISNNKKALDNPPFLPFFIISLKILLHNFLTSSAIYPFFTFYFFSILNKISPKLLYIIQTGNIGVLLGLKKVECFLVIKKELLFYYTDLQAEIGLENLKRIRQINFQLKNIFDSIKKTAGVQNRFPAETEETNNVYWRIPLYADNQFETMRRLLKKNIETSLSALPVCSEEDCFKKFNAVPCESAVNIHNHYLLLPSFSNMDEQRIKYLANQCYQLNPALIGKEILPSSQS